MRPNDAGATDDVNKEESTNKEEQKINTEGELSIDHSSKKEDSASWRPELGSTINTQSDDGDTIPNKKTSSSEQQTDAGYGSSPDSSSNHQPENPSVIVPGGMQGHAPNPATFFQSKYSAPNSLQAQQLNPEQPQAGQQYGPSPALSAYPAFSQKTPKKRQKIIIISAIITVLVIGTLGYLFGIYIPNKPENAYSNGLDRTGKALEGIVDASAEKEQIEKLRRAELDGTFEAKFGEERVTGTIKSKYDSQRLDAVIDATSNLTSETDQTYSASLLVEKKDGSTYPSSYFKVKGLAALGLDQFIPGISSFDDKWILVEDTLVKTLTDQYSSLFSGGVFAPTNGSDSDVSGQQQDITAEDVVEVSKIFTNVTREYVLTKSSDKSVLINKQFIGKETVDDTKTYHYQVAIHKENFGQYCKALNNALIDSKAYKKFAGTNEETVKAEKENGEKSCDESKADIDENETADLWINAKYKLIHKIRFTDKENPKDYVEIGQKYKGKNDLYLFTNIIEDSTKTTASVVLAIDMKTMISNLKADLKSDSETDNGAVTLSLDFKPINDDVSIEEPQGAIKLQDAATQLGINLEELLAPTTGLEPTN